MRAPALLILRPGMVSMSFRPRISKQPTLTRHATPPPLKRRKKKLENWSFKDMGYQRSPSPLKTSSPACWANPCSWNCSTSIRQTLPGTNARLSNALSLLSSQLDNGGHNGGTNVTECLEFLSYQALPPPMSCKCDAARPNGTKDETKPASHAF